MNFIIRIFITLILFGCFSIIVFVSFFSQNEKVGLIETDFPEVLKFIDTEEQEVYFKDISIFETLFTSSDDISIDVYNQENSNLLLSNPGEYLTSLRDIRKNYSFLGEGFFIEQFGAGDAYLMIQESGEVLLASLNTNLRLDFIGESQQEVYTSIYLYPHMYIRFHPKRGKFLKNADRIRIETVYDLGYISNFQSVFSEEESSSVSLTRLQESNFLKEALRLKDERSMNSAELLNGILAAKKYPLPGFDLIQSYMQVFLNDTKKEIYYQNLFLDAFLELLVSQSYNKRIIKNFEKEEKRLKSKYPRAYQEAKILIENIMAHVFMSPEKHVLIPKHMFLQISNMENAQDDAHFFPLYSYSLFEKYNQIGEYDPTLLSKYFESFLVWSSSDRLLTKEYFLFFLESQLNTVSKELYTKENIQYISSLLSRYLSISSQLYEQNEKTRTTALFVYEKILGNLAQYVRSNFFQQHRNPRNILELHSNNTFSPQEFGNMKQAFQNFMIFFENNKQFLDISQGRDLAIYDNFLAHKEDFEEYLLALENYESYASKYDRGKKELLNFSVSGGNRDEIISQESFLRYIQQFIGISLNSLEVEIIEDTYYRVSGVYISGRIFQFDLYPYAANTLKNIIIDGKKRSQEYKLDIIESDWGERFRVVSQKEKELYDFSRFFLITFFTDVEKEVEILEDTGPRLSEDKTEIVFKRTKLLGEGVEFGEFEDLEDILDIEYSDIILSRSEDSYDVFLKDVTFTLKRENDNKIFGGVLSGVYDLSAYPRVFKKLKIYIYKDPRDPERGYIEDDYRFIPILQKEEMLENLQNIIKNM